MRTAIVTDIHGSMRGLEKVLEDQAKEGCERLICLGDLVSGGMEDEEVVAYFRDNQLPVTQGNHDLDDAEFYSDAARDYLRALPPRIVEGDVVYTHITPRDASDRGLACPYEARNAFAESSQRLAFVGHLHAPVIWSATNDDPQAARYCSFTLNKPRRLSLDDRFIIIVGAVAYARDMVEKIKYAIHDDAESTVEMRALDGPMIRTRWFL
ncbi:MAG: metallophosphoesterase family protein [Sumerlaeia bacterium]